MKPAKKYYKQNMSILRHFSVRTFQLQAADFCLHANSRHRTHGYG